MRGAKVPVIIGDVGGTNSRLSILKMSSNKNDAPELVEQKVLVSFQYESIEALLDTFLEPLKGTENYPMFGAIGFPGPIFKNTIEKITNIPHWPPANGDEIAQHLGLKKLELLNDFELNGYAAQLDLEEGKDFVYLNNRYIDDNEPKAIIGPGTGIGYSLLFKPKNSNYYEVVRSEGAHQDFAPQTKLEFEYMEYLREIYKVEHISVERASCGMSIVPMYLFLLKQGKVQPEPELKEKVLKLTNITSNDDTLNKINREIFEKGLKRECPLCRKVIEFFVGLLGNAAGNLSILTLCRGGIYLLGGLSVALEKVLIKESIFINHFVDKGRLKNLLVDIPVMVIRDTDFGVRGAKEFVRRLIEEDEKNSPYENKNN